MTEAELLRYLSRAAGRPVALRINSNSTSILNVKSGKKRGELSASVHRIFLDAPPDVLKALAGFMGEPTSADRAAIRKYIGACNARLERDEARRPKSPARPVGNHYDLAPVARRLNERHFGNKLDFDITWGRRPRTPPRDIRLITLGLCQRAERRIRVHPILDDPRVPMFYLEYIVYHEMAHLAVPARVCSRTGKHHYHTREFYDVETAYPRYREAIAWQKANLDRLLRDWCRRPKTAGRLAKVVARAAAQLQLF